LDRTTKVALIRTDRRRGGVAEALALIADDLRERIQVTHAPIIIPSMETPETPWACTHRDTVSATVDAVLAAGANSITVAGSSAGRGSPASACFDRLGYRSELWGRPVDFHATDSEHEGWCRISWIGPRGEPVSFRVPSPVAASRCRISLSVPRTHGVFRLGLGLPGLSAILHPHDRHLVGARPATSIDSIPGQAAAVGLLQSCRGMAARAWLGVRSVSGGMRLTPPESKRLQEALEATSRLATLAAFLPSSICVIDGFDVMQGEGPRHGGRLRVGFVIASTDAVAADAVAAAVLGYDPREIPYLRQAHALGLGTAEPATITIVGDAIARARRPIRRHSSDAFLRLVPGPAAKSPGRTPGPHFGSVPRQGRVGRAESR
jgi:uncharacterized protein (DUF362 family)